MISKALAVLSTLAATASAVVATSAFNVVEEPPARAAAAIATVEARPVPIRVEVRAKARLTASGRTALYSPVEGRVRIVSILPSGTKVKTGDIVVELDAADLRESLFKQTIASQAVELTYEQAKLARNLAEIDVQMYEQTVYAQEKAGALQKVQLAEADLARSEKQAERMKRFHELSAQLLEKRGEAKTPLDVLADQELGDRLTYSDLNLKKDRFALELARSELELLEKFTHPKVTKEHQFRVEKARSDEEAGKRKLSWEKEKATRLERQIAQCSIRSPINGVVVEAQTRGGGRLKAGSQVLEAQMLALVQAPNGRLMAEAMVPESRIDLLERGQPAKVVVPGGSTLDGTIESIASWPDRSSQDGPGETLFAVQITLPDPPPSVRLRSGQGVEAVFAVDAPERALGVPTKALLWYDGAFHVGVRGAAGDVEWREVVPGLSNAETTEVRSGLTSGEAVVVGPDPHLSDDQRRRISIAPPPADLALSAEGS
ncbi:efflux RND transporter periplasmic adaptor subunit [Paludisphaera mucosa]|uniref:HlyD family efflux transporter periplasmic adaptor subunit n=1 Tax=Paludisphaera mucosa TaxID=3030827 RepID=A0ABT6FJW7_9BACT|nr:HlyD family efflux transporter periplasmic adaptor subunit [Paludisphaera mucosa]MDG3007878.1 HlyD family efflux transporter periplasmic adaptor subunit [Paludisphaera mucosa]